MKRVITITFDDEHGADWDVAENGKCCNGLGWDEMLGQVAMLTIPLSRVGIGYVMRTPQEWAEYRAAQERKFSNGPKQADPPFRLAAPEPVIPINF